MNAPVRRLFFSVEDREGKCVEGVLVRFCVNNRILVEGRTTCDKPLDFSIDSKVEVVDVEIFFGRLHEWLKIPMDSEWYKHTIDLPASTPPANPQVSLSSRPPLNPVAPADGGDGGTRWNSPFSDPRVIVAIIGAIAAIVAAYWQFVYKPNQEREKTLQNTVQLTIAVRNLSDQAPVAKAHVEIEDGSRHPEGRTDEGGLTPTFSLNKKGSSSLNVVVDALHFESANRNIDRPTDDRTETVYLKPQGEGMVNNPSAVHRRAKLAGTWDIEAPSDPSNARMSNGTFTFVPQADTSVLLTGHFSADGTAVSLDGTCGVQGQEGHILFNAKTAQGGSWSGTGDLRFDSPTRITGRIQSKRGDDIPFVLTKP